MATTRIAFNKATRTVTLLPPAGPIPSGSTVLGSYDHSDEDSEVPIGASVSHVDYHHVRDRLYFEGELDMQVIKIVSDRITSISMGAGALTVAVGANSVPLVIVPVPADVVGKPVTFASSDATKATVNSAGVVTGVAEGSAIITATLVGNTAIKATKNVTVVAA